MWLGILPKVSKGSSRGGWETSGGPVLMELRVLITLDDIAIGLPEMLVELVLPRKVLCWLGICGFIGGCWERMWP